MSLKSMAAGPPNCSAFIARRPRHHDVTVVSTVMSTLPSVEINRNTDTFHDVHQVFQNIYTSFSTTYRPRLPYSPNSCVLIQPGENHCRHLRSEEHTSELQSLRHLVCR